MCKVIDCLFFFFEVVLLHDRSLVRFFFFFEVIPLHDRSLVRCDDNKKPCRSGDRFRMLSEDETNRDPALLTDPRSQTRRPRSPCEPLVRTPPLLHTHIRTPFNNAGIKNSRAVLTRGMILNRSRGDSLQTIFFLIESCLRCNGHFEVSEVTDEGSVSSC